MSQGSVGPSALPRIEAIVVGASAGGVEALLSVFSEFAAGFCLPVIVVLHLPDERRSQLAEVFARRVALPVKEAEDKQTIVPGTLYFAAPGYHLSVEQDRSLSLSLEARVHHSRPAIDYLFESAADAYGPGLAAVLLTGADILVRLIPTDAELKLGVVTAFLGVPVFLFHLLRERRLW